MTDPRHARILANIAKQVAAKHKRSGMVTVDEIVDNLDAIVLKAIDVLDESWNYTLPEEYQG